MNLLQTLLFLLMTIAFNATVKTMCTNLQYSQHCHRGKTTIVPKAELAKASLPLRTWKTIVAFGPVGGKDVILASVANDSLVDTTTRQTNANVNEP